MKRFLPSLPLLFLCFVPFVHGEEAGNRPAAVAPASAGIRELRDIPYVSGGGDRQKLDLFLPARSESPRPLVVWVHGGAWQAGSKDNCPAKPLVAKGYVVASIGYRLSQQATFPAQIEDCKAAVRWLRAHAVDYGIDPDRIGAWGASAGGHLVALLGTTGQLRDFDVGENLDQSSSVQCVIDWFGPTDFLHYGDAAQRPPEDPNGPLAKLIGGLPSENMDKVKRCSPISYVQAKAAPFLIMQGDHDPLVPAQQSEELNDALQKAGVSSALRILPGAGHGGPLFTSAENIKLMTDFLQEHLQPSVTARP